MLLKTSSLSNVGSQDTSCSAFAGGSSVSLTCPDIHKSCRIQVSVQPPDPGDLTRLDSVPRECDCQEETKVFCDYRGFTEVPSPLPEKLTFLDISGNNLNTLPRSALGYLPHLDTLRMTSSRVVHMEPGLFTDCPSLSSVILTNNKFTTFTSAIFDSDNNVRTLNLLGNSLSVLRRESLSHMEALNELTLRSNQIHDIESGAFLETPSLEILFIAQNRITVIQPQSFADLSGLTALYLAENRLTSLQATDFTGLHNLTVL
ncbi:leucine-rich repeat-containing G-protein coupled receptor 4 [Plakobranchus ocellatus]|uniref:Leucine-rich repeat-containing G-protein coupled receptor 4 n=1 Tax=Plakobranchus ocellatus TaxID=259542 RepID=A0AAV4AAJ2_9GAST|nr:leucine-rich repeat-containing G-protein coupled receptor 4 [Plakobranchus ocellatus]